MDKEIKFGYFHKNIVREFKKEYLEEDRFHIVKFAQFKINGENYIRAGHLGDITIFRETLNEFELKFETGLNNAGFSVPFCKGDNYELVGVGELSLTYGELNFHSGYSDYFHCVKGANRNNLETIFERWKLSEYEGIHELPCFIVKI